MQYSSPRNNHHSQSTGFTLIEMLVVAPIVILAIGGFISLMVNMVGDVIAARDETVMMYETQDSLSRIEDDVSLSTAFLSTSDMLITPQGSDANFTGTAAFTNTSNTLILNAMVTDRNPLDPLRELIYYNGQPNPCDATKVFNKVLYSKVIYFIKSGSLWRRTAISPYNTNTPTDIQTVCATPWQQNSCSPGYVATRCKTNDIEIMKNVSSLNVAYYASANSSTDIGPTNAAVAKAIKVTVVGQKKSAGRDIATTQSVRATRLNASALPPPVDALQFSQNPISQSVIYTDTNVQFTATPLFSDSVSVKWQQSTNGGSTWADISGATSTTLTIPTVSLGMNGYQYRAVATSPNETATSTVATLTVTIWGDINFLNGYSNYLNTYSTAGYTRTTAGVVMLKGLIKKSSAVVAGDIIGTLPPGARPSNILIFQTITNSNVGSRVDIYPNGDIVMNVADAGWLSLEGINFIPAGTSYTRNPLTTVNSWVNYGGPYSTASYVMDSVGRVNVEGLVRNGTITNGTQVVNNLPASARAGEYLHLPSRNSSPGLIGIDPTTGIVAKGTGGNGYMSLNSLYYPASFGSWTNLALQNAWVAYAGGFATPQYAKGADNIVRLKGLIKSGTTTNGTVVTNLPAGFRPKDRTLLSAVCNPNVVCRVDVLPNGNVELYLSDSGWTSLDSVTFYAEL
jgi:competence protein ComGC